MTVLSVSHSSRIRNRSMGVLHLIAADEGVEYSDILTLITPSQPIPQAPAARTSESATPDVQAEVPAPQTSADPIEADIPAFIKLRTTSTPSVQARDDEADGLPASPVVSTSQPGAEGAESPAPIPPSHQAETLGEEVTAPRDKAATGKSARAKAPAAPKRKPRSDGKTIRQVVEETHQDHPDWDAEKVAEHIGEKIGTVRVALADARAKAGTSLAEPVPAPNPQQPVGSPVKITTTLGQRVRAMHNQHPTWTARMIANELGAPLNSVRTMLAGARSEAKASAPEFAGRAALQSHYAEVGKRLGKRS